MRFAPWMVTAVLLLGSAPLVHALEGNGLKYSAEPLPGAHWQGRLTIGGAPNWQPASRFEGPGLNTNGISLMADYYFTAAPAEARAASGLRATSGIVVGPRSQFWGSQIAASSSGPFSIDRRVFGPRAPLLGADAALESGAVPYIGIGYTGPAARGGWSFSADLGLMSLRPGGAVKLGGLSQGSQGLDELLRNVRLSPVLQLGASYAF